MAGDGRVQQGGVEHGAGAGPGLVQRGRQRDQPVAAHPAVRRLDADRAGDGGRLPDRAAGVGADRDRRLERRDRRRRAAAGAAGDAVEVPGVVGRAEGRVLGRAAHGELVHVRLAEDHDPGLAQAAHDRRVVRRPPALEDARAAGRGHALGGDDVLERERHAGQRTERLARPAPGVDAAGRVAGALGVDVQERVDGGVDGLDPGQVRVGHVERAGLPGGDGSSGLGGRQPDEIGHASSPRMRGTRNRPSSAAGAPDSACS